MRALLPALLLVLAPACTPKPRCGPGPTRLEVRDGDGALTLRIAEGSRKGELDLCDPAGQRTGSIERDGEGLRLHDRLHADRLSVDQPGALEVTGPSGPFLRVFRRDKDLRVLRPDGVAFGTLSDRDDTVFVADEGGSPIAKTTPRDADAVVMTIEGKVQAYLVPSPGLLAAAIFALPGLALEDRVFLAANLGGLRLQP